MHIEDTIITLRKLVDESDTILIGAGSGLSTAGGLNYEGKRFTENFADFIAEYNLTDMYSSAFYPFKTKEEKWAYFSRHIKLNRYDVEVLGVYKNLLKLVENKNYFVITTNGDGQFEEAGFDTNKLFATQGDYRKFQCSKPCHDRLYDNEEMVMKMVELQSNCKIPSELIPKCPVCGEDLAPHLRMDGSFVEDEDWHKCSKRYTNFVRLAKDKKLLLLELGIGFNTPSIIRWPFEQLSIKYRNSYLVRLNKDNIEPSYPISDNNLLLKVDITEMLDRII